MKELLIIVRDNLTDYMKDVYHYGGICSVIHALEHKHIITDREDYHLNRYLKANKPRNAFLRYKRHYVFDPDARTFDSHGYALWLHWWTPGRIKPRIKYLNSLIEKL